MSQQSTRRRFLGTAAACGAGIGLEELGFLTKLPPVSAADAKLDANSEPSAYLCCCSVPLA